MKTGCLITWRGDITAMTITEDIRECVKSALEAADANEESYEINEITLDPDTCLPIKARLPIAHKASRTLRLLNS